MSSNQYNELQSQIHQNWNLSQYARHQREMRTENTKLSKEEQQEKMIQVYNNRPPVNEAELQVKSKQITSFVGSSQAKQKQPLGIEEFKLGVIHPEKKYEDPRSTQNAKKQQELEWYASRFQEPLPKRPENPLVEPQPDLKIQAAKILLKPPPQLEKEKPFLQDHLVNPYIYIKKVFKKNNPLANMDHPDIWDKSGNTKSRRVNKQPKVKGHERPQSAVLSKEDKKDIQKEKEERAQFYLQNMKMREFLFKFFKNVNRLVKERKFNKVIYQGDREKYDLPTLFQLWAQHKKVSFQNNPEKYLTKEQFTDFLLVIGLDPEKNGEAGRFFDYCHDDVAKGTGMNGGVGGDQEGGQHGAKKDRWWRLFKDQ